MRPLAGALLLFLVAVLQPAAAQSARAADEVLAAVRAGNEQRLRQIASRPDLDAWVVAWELCARGESDAARTLAAAVPAGPNTDKLAAYVSGRARRQTSPELKQALAQAEDPHADPAQVVARLEKLRREGDEFERARVALALGLGLQRAGGFAKSAAVLQEAGVLAERVGWLHGAAEAFYVGGISAHEAYDYDTMVACWERLHALDLRRGNTPGARIMLGNLGSVYGEMGDLKRALEIYGDLARMYEGDGNRGALAHVLGNMGTAHVRRGHFAAAQRSYRDAIELAGDDAALYRKGLADCLDETGEYEDALRIYAEVEPELEGTDLAEALGNAGMAAFHLGKHELAVAKLQKAAALLASDPRGARLAAGVDLNLSWVHYETGDHQQARGFALRALEGARKVRDPWLEGYALVDLALAQDALGKTPKALECFAKALALAKRVGSDKLRMSARHRTAQVLLARGKAGDAVREADAAIESSHALVRGLAVGQGARARATRAELFDVALRAALAIRDPATLCRFLEASRAGALLESLSGRDEIRAAAVPAGLLQREEAARFAVAKAEAVYRRAFDAGLLDRIEEARARREQAREALEDIIRAIQTKARAGADLAYPRPAPLATIQGWLEPDEALVLYALLTREAFALVVTGREARVAKLPAPDVIREACAALRVRNKRSDPKSQITTLRRLVLEPLGLEPGTRRLLVSPDGALFRVPFGVLARKRVVVYVPSATTYGLLREARKQRGRDVLALGDPAYPAQSRWPRLRGSGAEAANLGDETLLGKKANIAALTAALKKRTRWRAVHLACHSLVDTDEPLRSMLALSDGELDMPAIYGLRIPADLVVLSACETGGGAILRAEGLVGLTRAFMFAGAPRVIVSLWKVDDEATQALMMEFYRRWNPKSGKGDPIATALKEAQEHVASREEWQHEYYWAAWQLWGLHN